MVKVYFTTMRVSGYEPLPDKMMRLAQAAGIERGVRIGLGASEYELATVQ